MGQVMAFYVFGGLAVVFALVTILHRNIFKSATFLAGMLFCLAALFITLDAEFLAVVQVLVYIGAITILILFAIMLTMRINDETRDPFNSQRFVGPVIGVGVMVLIVTYLFKSQYARGNGSRADLPADLLGEIGQALLSHFILPFDVVTVLLLVALVGAAYLAGREGTKTPAEKAAGEEEEKTEVMVH